jgi:hypothetical protein
MSCVTSADAALTGGILGVASLRVGVRRLLPNPARWAHRVPADDATARQDTRPAVDDDRTPAHA